MKFVIITHTPHFISENRFFAYGPYIREMNLWAKHADELLVVAPVMDKVPTVIHAAYATDRIAISSIPSISFISVWQALRAIILFPVIWLKIFSAMRKADHIHLRCPGTIGLIGCLVQLFFPKKSKTAKYAGNWDPNAKQPLSYRLQKWILANHRVTKNIKVLVYGDWKQKSPNVNSFFTATYPASMKETLQNNTISVPFKFLFVGSLTSGKRPLYAVQLVEKLHRNGVFCSLSLYGEGAEREKIADYLKERHLTDFITLHGNVNNETVTAAYKESDFLILPSKSEGWPKVVAEAMFWGVIPIATPISCVSWMLHHGKRGIVLQLDLEADTRKITTLLTDKKGLQQMSKRAQDWSHMYTLDAFENAIKKLL